MDWHRGDTVMCMELTNEVEIGWSPNLHLKLLTLADEMNSFKAEVSQLGNVDMKIVTEGWADSLHQLINCVVNCIIYSNRW